MKRLLILAVSILLIPALMSVMSCSDDDDNPVTTGDPNDPSYEFYSEAVGDLPGEANMMLLEITMDLLDWLEQAGSSQQSDRSWRAATGVTDGEFDSIHYTYGSGWHVFYFEYTQIDTEDDFSETLQFVGYDSVRTFEDGAPVQIVDSLMDSLYARAHVAVDMANSDGEQGHIGAHHDLTAINSGIDMYGQWVTLSLSSLDSLNLLFEDEGANCSLAVVCAATGSNLLMPVQIEDACPTSGTLSASEELGLACTGGDNFDEASINGTWSVNYSFTDGVGTIRVTKGNVQWTVVDTCGIDR